MCHKKYNLLYIFTDQQRFDTLSAYGNNKIHVPNLNGLAEDSAVFSKTYVAQPVCTPSRGTLMTGLYPHNHGCVHNNARLAKNVPTIADIIKDFDYVKGYVGKWHLGDEVIKQHGFNHWVSIEDMYRQHYSKEKYLQEFSDYHHYLISNGFSPDLEQGNEQIFSRMFGTRLPEKFSRPAFIAEQCKSFISENKDESFILFAAFLEPHPPYNSAYDNYYEPNEVSLPPLFNADLGENRPLKQRMNVLYQQEVGKHYPLRNEHDWRKLISRYWGSITLVDKYIGQILDCLKENDLWENTVIVFTSDHGDMMGDYRMLQKGFMLEPSVRVPMMLRIPEVTDGGKLIEPPVSQVDLLPTIMDVLRQETQHLDGSSLLPALHEGQHWEPHDVFIEWCGDGGEHKWFRVNKDPEIANLISEVAGATVRAVVTTDGWKLCLQSAGEHELYDLKNDPMERRNLYGEERYSSKFDELKQKIMNWQKQTGDSVIF